MARQMMTTPVGEAYWAKILEPEEDRFDESKPRSWSISWCAPGSSKEALELVEAIEAEFKRINGDAKASKHAWPFREQTDKDGKATGQLEFRFRKNETTRKGQVLSAPAIYDSRKNPWPSDTLIGNGSKVKVAFSCWGWEDKFGGKGVSLSLEAVQVLDLVPYERVDPSEAFGVENGYVVDTPAAAFSDEKPMSMADKIRARAQEVAAEAGGEDIPF